MITKRYLVSFNELIPFKNKLNQNNKNIFKKEEYYVYYYYDTISYDLYYHNKNLRICRHNDKNILEMIQNDNVIMQDSENITIECVKCESVNNNIYILQGTLITSRLAYHVSDGLTICLDINYYLGNYDCEIIIVFNDNNEKEANLFSSYIKKKELAGHKYDRFFKLKAGNIKPKSIKTSDIITDEGRRLLSMARIIEYIDKNLYSNIKITEICREFLTNRTTLSGKFKYIMGLPYINYLLLRRIMHAQYLLTFKSMSNDDISAEVGFSDKSHFQKQFKKFVGMTPCRYRRILQKEINKNTEVI